MTNSLSRFGAGALLVTLVCAAPARGHDLNPPPFRGQPGTTFQAWEYNGPALGPPDGACPPVNPNGMAKATASGTMWLPTWAGLRGIQCLPLGGAITKTIPNAPDPRMLKTIWVQVTFHRHAGSDIDVSVADDLGNVAMPTGQQDLPVPGQGPNWVHRTLTYCFLGCPAEESVTLTAVNSHVDIDQFLVESFCGPDCEVPPAPAGPDDYDGDGVPDIADNAPGVFNPNQADCDNDGIGNVSDLWGICPPGTPRELERCGTDVNGGCNLPAPVFFPLTCGTSVCGTAWAENLTRDTDWYEVTVADVDGDGIAGLNVELCTAFPAVLFVLNDDCTNPVLLASEEANADMIATITECLPAPATYLIFVAPGTLAGGIFDGIPCGSANEYWLSADCFEPCP